MWRQQAASRIPLVCDSRPWRLVPPGMEMHWHKVVPGAFRICSHLTRAQLPQALVVGPGANRQAGRQKFLLLLFPRMELAKGHPFLPSTTARAPRPFWGRFCWKPRVCPSRSTGPGSGVRTQLPPQPHGMGPPSASRVLEAGKQVVAPGPTAKHPAETWPCCRNLAVLPVLSWATGDGGCGLRHTSLRPCACLVRSDQEEDQSALCSLSRFN